eukprot:TRINITY_DN11208_c0_g1_i1.p1 TRINITY_DN11208_c0_g1~~TRINITY_DN11208_c0_g1_i1.p1  ORF type:complete len:184 (-),score=48.12 TRINITY_DN11208_c0_g1_i1:77-592(-)
MNKLISLLFVCIAVSYCQSASFSTNFLGGRYNFEWTVDGSAVTFIATTSSSGWVGMGFSSGGGMLGANVVIGTVGSDGFGSVGEYNITAKKESGINPTPPLHIMLQEPQFVQVGGKSILKFTWDTTVPSSYQWTVQSPVKMVFAMGTSGTLAYHNKDRVQATVNLLTGVVN